jgi:hypothetical protein
MKLLIPIETDEYSLEVIECKYGFNIGIDTSYLGQVGPVAIACPSCNEPIEVGGF